MPDRSISESRRVKIRLPNQRSCNEKNAHGKFCAGHLKPWNGSGADAKETFGGQAGVYRCAHCHTVYLPAAESPSPESPVTEIKDRL